MRLLWPPLEASLMMAGVVLVSKILLTTFQVPPLFRLALCVTIGACMSLLLLLTRHRKLLDELLFVLESVSLSTVNTIRSFLGRRQAGKTIG